METQKVSKLTNHVGLQALGSESQWVQQATLLQTHYTYSTNSKTYVCFVPVKFNSSDLKNDAPFIHWK